MNLSADQIVDRLDTLLAEAATGDLTAAAQAHALFEAFNAYLAGGGALPAAWAQSATLTDPRTGETRTASISYDADGNWVVDAPAEVLNPRALPAPDPAIFADGDQFGFSFDEAEEEPEDDGEYVWQRLLFPVAPKAKPGTPRRNSAGDTDLPADVPSMLGHLSSPMGLNNPATSHQMDRKRSLKAGKFNHQVFWLLYDSPYGLTDHQMEAILGRSHQSVSATRNALMNGKYIEASGELRKTPFGNDANVWVPTQWARQRVAAGREKRL